MSVMSVRQKQSPRFQSLSNEHLKNYGPSLSLKTTYLPSSSGKTAGTYWNYRLVNVDGVLDVYAVTYTCGVPLLLDPANRQDSRIVEAFCNEAMDYSSIHRSFKAGAR